MRRSFRLLVVPAAALALVLAACGDDDSSSSATTAAAAATTAAATVKGDINVYAAASLKASFDEIGTAFTKANPDAKATFVYDGSSSLVQKITQQDAPADVFASADQPNMDTLVKAGMNGSDPVVFATNLLTVIVAPGNPKGITGVEDLDQSGLKVVLCDAKVPCGNYAHQILDKADVSVTPVSNELAVTGVVQKVEGGDADAGIVYVTDATTAGDKVQSVDIPADLNVVAKYPIATVKSSTKTDVAQAFIAFVLGGEGQAILTAHGFGNPS